MGEDTTSGGARTVREGCCVELSIGLPADERERDVRALSALANETRYGIVRLLSSAGEDVCVCDIEASLDASQSAISHALSSLYSAGLVDRRKEGRWRYYTTTPRAEALVSALDATREGAA